MKPSMLAWVGLTLILSVVLPAGAHADCTPPPANGATVTCNGLNGNFTAGPLGNLTLINYSDINDSVTITDIDLFNAVLNGNVNGLFKITGEGDNVIGVSRSLNNGLLVDGSAKTEVAINSGGFINSIFTLTGDGDYTALRRRSKAAGRSCWGAAGASSPRRRRSTRRSRTTLMNDGAATVRFSGVDWLVGRAGLRIPAHLRGERRPRPAAGDALGAAQSCSMSSSPCRRRRFPRRTVSCRSIPIRSAGGARPTSAPTSRSRRPPRSIANAGYDFDFDGRYEGYDAKAGVRWNVVGLALPRRHAPLAEPPHRPGSRQNYAGIADVSSASSSSASAMPCAAACSSQTRASAGLFSPASPSRR